MDTNAQVDVLFVPTLVPAPVTFAVTSSLLRRALEIG